MTLTEHLNELRKRLIRSFIAVFVGFLACYAFAEQLFDILMEPMVRVLHNSNFIYTYPPEAFFTYLKVSFVAGFFLVSPYLFYQVWLFVAPGLYQNERKYLVPIAIFSAVFFTVGALFGYFVVFPFGFEFFASYSTDKIVFTPKLSEYLSFALKLLFAFGVVFELPLVIFFLARLGLVTAQGLRRVRKYAILVIFIVAAILTPPDVFTQTLMAGPMILLYEFGIIAAHLFGKEKKKPAADEDEEKSAEAE
ncbi:twin-arginine translocase subunit TatC [Desulfocurvibacter africanus]